MERSHQRQGRSSQTLWTLTFAGVGWHHYLVSDTHDVAVGPKGRIVIPAPVRQELNIGEGSQLVAMVDDGGILLLPRSEVKRRLRSMFAGIQPSLADELIADRRRDAELEDGEA
jgi:AbrB family looped-hinge helix DNA binding protein